MKDERKELMKLKKEYTTVVGKLGALKSYFVSVGCRYRNNNKTCGHQRHNTKKYPQHQPWPVYCEPKVCPRN